MRIKPIQRRFGAVRHPMKADLEIKARDAMYRQCIELRNFEITNLLNRNNFFMVFQGVMIAGFFQGSGSMSPILQFLACVCATSVSAIHVMSSLGAKFWQEAWEEALENSERRLSRIVRIQERRRFIHFFSRRSELTQDLVKNRLNNSRHWLNPLILSRFSVSRAPIYAAITFLFFWFIVGIHTLQGLECVLCSFVTGLPK